MQRVRHNEILFITADRFLATLAVERGGVLRRILAAARCDLIDILPSDRLFVFVPHGGASFAA